jgi:hypothetical protein
MPLIDIEDGGTGSYSVTPAKLPDKEFSALAPPKRKAWGIFRTYYVSVSGEGKTGHDYTTRVLGVLGFIADVLLGIIVLAALFVVALCCIPGLAHLVL